MMEIIKRCRLYPLYRWGIGDGIWIGCFIGAGIVLVAITVGLCVGAFR